MCGIVAYTGHQPAAPVLLHEASRGASARGPHGHGWATSHDTTHHDLGPWNNHRFATDTHNVTWLLGHARLATNGRHRDRDALQPIHHHGNWMVHNGNVYNSDDLWPAAPVDSASLIKVYTDLRTQAVPPLPALDGTVETANMPAFALVIRDNETSEFLIHRRRLPLWTHTDVAGGIYVSSRPFAAAALIPENRTITSKDTA